jgi:hypothetical protein
MKTFLRVCEHMYFGYVEKCNKIFHELAWFSLNFQAFYQSREVKLSF